MDLTFCMRSEVFIIHMQVKAFRLKRLKEENAYLTSLIQSLLPKKGQVAHSYPYHPPPAPTRSPARLQQQEPVVLTLKATKNNSKFIIPIFKANKQYEQLHELSPPSPYHRQTDPGIQQHTATFEGVKPLRKYSSIANMFVNIL